MPINILMPALSPTMETGNLAKWLKKEGDPIKSGDVIAEIETDKATMEFEAVDEGTLGKILVAEGTENVAINQPIAILLTEGEDKSALASVAAEKPAAAAKPMAAVSPVAVAGPVVSGAVGAPSVPPGQPKSDVSDFGQSKDSQLRKTGVGREEGERPSGNGAGRVFASPLARRLAKEGGLDLSQMKGSGPHGRIIKVDIEAVKSGKAPLTAPAALMQEAGSAPRVLPVAGPSAGGGATGMPAMGDAQVMKLYEEGSYEVIPHDNVRKIIARRLVEAKTTIPHFYLTLDTEIDALLKLRADINAGAPRDKEGEPAWKVSVNDLIIKALAMALQRVPDANVTWTEGGMLQHKRSDVGVAVAIPGGLMTPVVRNAEVKRISEISNEMKDLAGRARVRKLAPHEYQGGTTAVSNLGMFGVKDFAAVINPPHATILAVGAGIATPVVRDGKVEVRTIMTVTLSTDHRAVDGALGAKFLGVFRDLIEKPAGMLA